MKKWGMVGLLLATFLLGGEKKITLVLTAETTKSKAEAAEKKVVDFMERYSGSGNGIRGSTEKAGDLWLAKVGPLGRDFVESGAVRKYLMRHYPDLLILPETQKDRKETRQRRSENGSPLFPESERWQWMVLLLLGTVGAIALIHRFGQVSRIDRRQKDLEKFQRRLEKEILKGEHHG